VSNFTTAIDATKAAIDAVLAAARAFTPSSAQGEAWVRARLGELAHLQDQVVQISTRLSSAFPAPPPAASETPSTPKSGDEAKMREALDLATGALYSVTIEANALAAALGAHKVPGAMTHKLSVEPTYTGSLRLGVAAPVFGASDGNYRVGMPPDAADTSQLVVLDDGSSPVDLELVVGYTQYFHRRPQSAVRPRVGAFAAVGLVDLEHAEVSVLESVYVGAEFGWTNLSLGVAATVRNVTRLGNGLDVGSPVTSTDPTGYTVDRPAFGVAFVVFPTPDIWKADFSKKKGTTTTTGGSSADATDGNTTGSGTETQ